MKVRFSSAPSQKRDAVVVTSLKCKKLLKAAKKVDQLTCDSLTRAVAATGFTGAVGQTVHIPGPPNETAKHLFLKGLGCPKGLGEKSLLATGKSLTALFNENGVRKLEVEVDKVKGYSAEQVAAELAFGAVLNSYSFDKYKTNAKSDDREVTFVVPDAKKARKAYKALEAVANGVKLEKDLANEPPNVLYPESFADRVTDAFDGSKVKVTVLDEKQMEKLGMGSHLAVGQGSVRPPRVVVMEYNGGKAGEKPVALVGKGITFDSGGLSLKSGGGRNMKYDMCGAATVVGTMKALSDRKAKTNVVAVIGLAENMPSGHAYRPDDVVKSLSGKTVEVSNTDAEGRLVLIDALTYVQQNYDPKAVVDLATLTGHIISALGNEYAGLFANDDELAAQLQSAGEQTDEKLWRMPVGGSYAASLSSNIADIHHMGGRAGSSVAASFLHAFIDEGRKWAHLDIAGTAHTPTASGFGVRLLDRLISDNYETTAAEKKKKIARPQP